MTRLMRFYTIIITMAAVLWGCGACADAPLCSDASCSDNACGDQAVVSLHDQAVVAAGHVTLGDVAQVTGAAATIDRLAAVSLGSAPVAGRERRISAEFVRLRLRRYGMDPENIVLEGDGVVVQREEAVPVLSRVAARPNGVRGALHIPRAADSIPAPTANEPAPPLVSRNQPVGISVVCGGVVIYNRGRVLEEGRAGDIVTVRLDGASHSLQAVVSGPGQLTLHVGGTR